MEGLCFVVFVNLVKSLSPARTFGARTQQKSVEDDSFCEYNNADILKFDLYFSLHKYTCRALSPLFV